MAQLSSERWTALQLRTLVLCIILNMLDGADVLVVSFAAPVLTRDWAMSAEMLGVVFGGGLAGMTLGALVIAPLSDLVGRRTMILAATAIIGSGMIASAWAANIQQLVGLRFWTGLGIGSMLASVAALASEYAPSRHRAFAVTTATAGYPLGATLTGLAAGWLLPRYGWQGPFLAAGLGSAIMLPLCWALLPESVQFLVARQPRRALERINRALRSQRLPVMASLPPIPPTGRRAPVTLLFAGDLRLATLLTWGAFFCAFFTLYFLTSWIPRIAVDAGFALNVAINGSAIFNMGAFIGLILLGWFASHIDLGRLIAAFFVLASIVMILFGAMHRPVALFYAGMLVIGFLVQGGFGGLYAVAAKLYPAAVRTTGVGWAIGAGRFGAIIGPMAGGLIIGLGFGLFESFVFFALPMIAAALLTWLVSRNRLDSAKDQREMESTEFGHG